MKRCSRSHVAGVEQRPRKKRKGCGGCTKELKPGADASRIFDLATHRRSGVSCQVGVKIR